MSVLKGQMDVVITALILLGAICVSVWMDINWNQIIILVQVITYCSGISITVCMYIRSYYDTCMLCTHVAITRAVRLLEHLQLLMIVASQSQLCD